MTPQLQHYLLFTEASRNRRTLHSWRFVLQNLSDQTRFTASDQEESATFERLELLAVVRGLEALDESAQVTLVTKSRYVSRGLRLGLDEWRTNNWQWERFGKRVHIRDYDLWQRVDRALKFHDVHCQMWHFQETSNEETEDYRQSEFAGDAILSALAPQTRHVPELVSQGPRRSSRRFKRVSTDSYGELVGASA